MYYWNSINHNNGKLLFKDCFGDTIYQITAEKDIPYLVLNKGKYKMPLEIASTLDILYKEGHHYIQQDYCIIASRYCFLSFNYDNKKFYDIWDMPDSRLVYRNIVQSQRDAIGFPVKLNDKTIHVWIDFAKDNLIYCVVSPEDALELIPTLPEDTNPVILEIELI
jgi:hypothetical protein